MSTTVVSLSEFAEMLADLAEDWDGEEPAVLIGDEHGDYEVTEKDGFSTRRGVGYAHDVFKDNGVWTLGQKVDARFFGTLLVEREHLSDEARDHLEDDDEDDEEDDTDE